MPNLVDIISLVVVLLLVFLGAMAGFTKKILSLVSWVLAAAAAFYWFQPVEAWALKLSGMPTVSALVASFGVFLCFLILLMILCSKIAGFVKGGAFKGADRVLGALLGGVTAVIVLGIGYRIMDALEIPAEMPGGKPTHIKPWVMTWTEHGWHAFKRRLHENPSLKKAARAGEGAPAAPSTPSTGAPAKPIPASAPKSGPMTLWEATPGAQLMRASENIPTISAAETRAQSAAAGMSLSPIIPSNKPNFLVVSEGDMETPAYPDLERDALTKLMEHADA